MELLKRTVMRAAMLSRIWPANIVIALVGFNIAPAQSPSQSDREAKDVLSQVAGYVIWTKSRTELAALSLPARKESVVRQMAAKDAAVYPIIHAISGPDKSGRIAYIEDHFFVFDSKEQRHLLKTIQIDGTKDVEIFSRSGSAMWAASGVGRGEIGAHVALAPTGGRVALLSGLIEKQMPRALLHEGQTEIWDIENKRRCERTTKALNQPMCWFPDGKRLAYVRLVAADELPERANGLEAFGKPFGETWERVPAVYVLDVDSGKTSFVHVGWKPVVSSVGDIALIGGWDSRSQFSWMRLDLKAGSTSAVEWLAGDAFALPMENIVLFSGLPTGPVPLRFTKNNSALVGPKPLLTLQMGVMKVKSSELLISDLDPRDLVSYGRVVQGK